MSRELREYRELCRTEHKNGQSDDLDCVKLSLALAPTDPTSLRLMFMPGWVSSLLVAGPEVFTEPYEILSPIFEAHCRRTPSYMGNGELSLASHANLFACAGRPDHTHYFKPRLQQIETDRHGLDASPYHSKVFASIALGDKWIYQIASGVDVQIHERLPFQPYERHGFNSQSLIAHLAGAVENQASLEEVWPAFEEAVQLFPWREGAEEFDGSCLLWIARIVHHQIGRQPLGETAAWLYQHFNAWADEEPLPPLLGK